jgi:hypothetical protein
MLVCGSDMFVSFATPGVWSEEHVRRIFVEHGVVCVVRPGSCVDSFLSPTVCPPTTHYAS